VTGREGKSRAEFTFVDVEICAADPAGVNPEKDFVALDFWDRNIPIFEFTRGIVNNCFHNEINKPAIFWSTAREETWGYVCCEGKQSQATFKNISVVA
jgi:hypothetical protein